MEYIPLISALVVTGIFAGLLAGLLGVGGGIVIVPVLYFIFQHFGMDPVSAMALATGTSLATIVPTSISSIRSHNARGNIDWELIRRWSLWIVVGVFLGGLLVSQYRSTLFVMLFAVIVAAVSIKMLLPSESKPVSLPGGVIQRAVASVIGFLSVMIGIGGGTLGVPILSKFNYQAHKAVGTAAVFGLLIALPGVLMMLLFAQTPLDSPVGTYGAVHLPSFLAIVPLTILMAPIGVKLGQKLPAQTLKRVFAVVLLITSIRMFMQAIGV